MHREIRLKENALDDIKTKAILSKGSYGVLSTMGEDGYPYGVPLNYAYQENCICFHCAQKGHKLENLSFNDKVSFTVVTRSDVLANKFDTDYESAVAFGTAIEVTERSEKEAILISIINKYSAEFMKAGKNYMQKHWGDTKVYKVEIDYLTGKAYV